MELGLVYQLNSFLGSTSFHNITDVVLVGVQAVTSKELVSVLYVCSDIVGDVMERALNTVKCMNEISFFIPTRAASL